MNKRCANRLSNSEIENRANESKISNVTETRSRNRRDLVSKGKIGIKNKTELRLKEEQRHHYSDKVQDFVFYPVEA